MSRDLEVLYVKLPRHVKNMSAAELRQYFPAGTDKSCIMRSIIMSEKNYGTVTYERSLRSFWYSAVKPTLDKLGLLSSGDQTEEGLTKWDATLSRYMVDLLKRGLLTYADLHIVDNSRRRDNPSSFYKTDFLQTYAHQITTAPYPNIIIATEKDTVYNIIRDLAKLLGCSCISSKGQNSMGAMEDLVRGIIDRDDITDDIHIITMTDYDPAGYYIAEALEDQVRAVLNALGTYRDVTIERIGITPMQLSPELVEANKYTPKEANRAKWFDRTGGIDGEEKGLELDALEPDEIRRIFIDNIKDLIDPDAYTQFIKRAYVQQKFLEYAKYYMQKMERIVINRFEADIEVKDFDIFDLAAAGYSTFPINALCLDKQDTLIKADVESAFTLALEDLEAN
jgi:hypothetical protein